MNSIFRRCSRIWRNLLHRKKVEDDLDAEVRAYVELEADRYTAAGMERQEAIRIARAEAGGIEQAKEAVREVRAGSWIESVLRDLRFGGRLLARNPGFTFAALLMLAVGVGANTAIFSVLNALVLRGLPYAEPERIVMIYEKRPRESNLRNAVSAPDFLDWRDQSKSFESMAAVVHSDVDWQSDSGPERIPSAFVTSEVLDVYGVSPVVGSGFRKGDSAPLTAVLSFGFWQRRFGGDPAVLGKPLRIAGQSIEISGVLPAGFEYPNRDVEILLPLQWRSREGLDRASHGFDVVARLKPNISLAAAQTEMDGIAARLEAEYAVNRGHGANVVPMADVLLGPLRRPLFALQAAAVLVLLVACGSLANLLLARMLARERELAIRFAVGAGRGQVFRQLLCESLLIAVTGGGLGVAVAYAILPAFRYLTPDQIPLVGIQRIGIDASLLWITSTLSVLCALVFGLAPAWRALGLGKTDGAARTPNRAWVHGALVAFQMAFAVVLLCGTAMFLRSFIALRSVDPGFQAQGVLTMQAALPGSRYKEPERVLQVTDDWFQAVRRMPGVQAVGMTSHLPVSGMDGRRGLAIKGVNPPDPSQPRRAHPRWVSPGYFEAMGLRIVQGRAFLETDRAMSRPVMIVNEAAARRFFPNGKTVGHWGKLGGSDGPWYEVVGVVADVRHWGLDVEANPEQYYCHLQHPSWTVNLVLRASGDLGALTPSIRREFWRVADASIPITRVQTMEDVVSRSIKAERSILILLGVFGAIALLLTSAGIWGTAAYLLSQRKREIGIRLALGATDGRLIRQVVGGAMKAALCGAFLGVILATLMARATAAKLFGVSTSDPSTYAGVIAVCVLVAALANYIPATRILRSTPRNALYQD